MGPCLAKSDIVQAAEQIQNFRTIDCLNANNSLEPAEKPSVAVGIDLGTTYTRIAIFLNDKVEVIYDGQLGPLSLQNCLAFTADGEVAFGDVAKTILCSPSNFVFDAKRLIGTVYSDEVVQSNLLHWPFKIVKNGLDKLEIEIILMGERKLIYDPQSILSMILLVVKKTVDTYYNDKLIEAVISIPASYNRTQRKIIKDAAKRADIKVLRLVNDASLTALAHCYEKNINKGNALVFDLGGGVCSASIVSFEDGVIEVISRAERTNLGGQDFTNCLVNYFVYEFRKRHDKNLYSDKAALGRLRVSCEEAKVDLSTFTQATIEIDSLFGGIDLNTSISRIFFEELCKDLFKKVIDVVQEALIGAKVDVSTIESVLLAGGSTKIPKIQRLLKDFFPAIEIQQSLNPVDESVAYGAALYASCLHGNKSEKLKDLLIVDVVPMSLGIETKDGVMTKFIEENTPLPISITKKVTTTFDYQRSVLIEIYEGNSALTKDNNLLGMVELKDILQATEGVPPIKVTFDIGIDGTLKVSVFDKYVNEEARIVIVDEPSPQIRPIICKKLMAVAMKV